MGDVLAVLFCVVALAASFAFMATRPLARTIVRMTIRIAPDAVGRARGMLARELALCEQQWGSGLDPTTRHKQ